MKYLNADVHGKFILKPRNSARSQQQKNMKEKTFKKQRTSITSQLDRSSVPHQDQVCTTPPVKMGRKLFGRELSSICRDGILPAAILDMLYLLKEKGPTSTVVFLEPLSISLCQTVKDKLDSEEEVDINKQSVNVVTWIFKETKSQSKCPYPLVHSFSDCLNLCSEPPATQQILGTLRKRSMDSAAAPLGRRALLAIIHCRKVQLLLFPMRAF